MEIFNRWAAEVLTRVLSGDSEILVQPGELETPPDPTLGDVAFPCFKLSKAQKKAPQVLAQELVQKIESDHANLAPLLRGLQVKAAGPYVNFLAPKNVLYQEILPHLLGAKTSAQNPGETLPLIAKPKASRGKWVIEYSSPNVAKPFMIYHFRPTGLGASLDRIGRARGYDMISINHLGDWGTQFGKLFVAHELFGADLPAEPGIDDLVKIYVKFHEAIEKDKTLEDRARAAFQRLEKKDPEVLANWKKCIEISMREFNKLYAKLNVRFDHIWGESFYEAELAPLLQKLKSDGVLTQSEGAWIANVTDEKGRELPPFILEKSDGSTIYGTRDVAAALYREREFHFDRMTYIVGGEQKLHFQQVFGVLRKMGLTWVDRCEHVPTGLYRFKDSKMSTRKGNFVTLNDVFELAQTRVRELMKERGSDDGLTSEEFTEISEKVALGAIVFHDLHSDPGRDVEFDVEKVVDFEGETGPYLQYAHTRCLSILRKAASAELVANENLDDLQRLLTNPSEVALVRTFGQFPKVLERCLETRKLSTLTHFLVDVSRAFGGFYRECQVVSEDKALSAARLALVDSTRKVLFQGLSLLGIPLPERM
jgi:arginyl-tRNA synthetase